MIVNIFLIFIMIYIVPVISIDAKMSAIIVNDLKRAILIIHGDQ